jgi:uncharacterized RDD family membrane protein YckC
MTTTNASCSLCNVQTKEAKLLYEQPVCRNCYSSFANLRYFAFIADMVIMLILAIVLAGIWEPLVFLLYIAFLGKDCLFSGSSPGKALAGLRVIDQDSGEPIGLFASTKRNLPLWIPPVGFIIQIMAAVQLPKGQRIGDTWANTKVVWKKYVEHTAFLPTSHPHFVWTEELRNEAAERKFSMALKAEIQSRHDDAVRLYQEVIDKFPETPIVKDAKIALDALQKRVS